MAVQVPLIGGLLILAFHGCDPASSALVFCMCVSALWFGVFSSVREIVSEYGVYQHERLLGLRVTAYVASKLPVLAVLSVAQVAGLVLLVYPALIAETGAGFSYHAGQAGGLFLILVLTAFGGSGLGLMLSALSLVLGRASVNRSGDISSEVAMSLVPLALFPQIVLGGPFFTYDKTWLLTRALSRLTLSRWSLSAALNLDPSGPQTLARRLGIRGESWEASCVAILCLSVAQLAASVAVLRYIERRRGREGRRCRATGLLT
jgi:hypothetical protein